MRKYIYYIIEGSPSMPLINTVESQTNSSTIGWNEDKTKFVIKTPADLPVPERLLEEEPMTKQEAMAEIDTWHSATKTSLGIS